MRYRYICLLKHELKATSLTCRMVDCWAVPAWTRGPYCPRRRGPGRPHSLPGRRSTACDQTPGTSRNGSQRRQCADRSSFPSDLNIKKLTCNDKYFENFVRKKREETAFRGKLWSHRRPSVLDFLYTKPSEVPVTKVEFLQQRKKKYFGSGS